MSNRLWDLVYNIDKTLLIDDGTKDKLVLKKVYRLVKKIK